MFAPTIPTPGSRRVTRCAPRLPVERRPSAPTSSRRSREHGGRLLVRLAGVADRDAADALRGSLFVIDSDELPPIDEADTYYDHQLEGLRVRTTTASRSVSSPRCCTPRAASCWPSRRDRGEVLVPFVSAIVTSVSLDDGVVEIDPPDGLLDLESCEDCRRDVKIDVVTIFPALPRSAATVVAGQGNRVGPGRSRGARPASVDARRAPLGRRRALRRWPGDGDEGAGVG